MKLALNLIVKGTDEEAEFLDRCLTNLAPHVDGIFITSTFKKGDKPNKEVEKVCKKHKANVSYFEWENDFAKARNFNFSQTPKEYEYILWCDADDIFDHPEKIRGVIKENRGIDSISFWYYYEFDKYRNPIVVHKKTQIVKNDGCVEWIGRLHEDFKENRSISHKFVDSIHRIHLTTESHAEQAQKRNVEISEEEAKLTPQDPRVFFNLGNSHLGAGNYLQAKEAYTKFLLESQSEEEKYIIHQRLSMVEKALGNQDKAIEHLLISIGMNPEIPDSYNQIGYLYFEYNFFDLAEKYLLLGLVRKPQYHKMIVYNPRDYDFNPMMALAKVYFNKSRPDYALPLLKGCQKISPNDKHIGELIAHMEIEIKRLEKAIEVANRLDKVTDKEEIAREIAKLDDDMQAHPAICRIRNQHFIKETSTGKDIAYYCGETTHEWNPELFKTKGFGGSEEAVINLSKQWAKQGYNVTVFNSCGLKEMTVDGVTYKPYWFFNAKDKYDHLVLWRHPRLLDHEINATNIYVDLHDVIPKGEFTEKRIAKLKKVFVKTKTHRDLFPNVPDEKMVIIPNGLDTTMFDEKMKRDPFLIINTSSPDRSMDVMPALFKQIKERVPQAKMKWAYGWNTFDASFKNDKKMMEWRYNLQKEIDDAGIESLGKIPQAECAKLYLEGSVFAYPTEFMEIDCISVKKAQAAGCTPVTTDFGALAESCQYGVKIHSNKNSTNWAKPYQFTFGLEDKKKQQEWVEAVVAELNGNRDRQEMQKWARDTFNWELISNKWIQNLN